MLAATLRFLRPLPCRSDRRSRMTGSNRPPEPRRVPKVGGSSAEWIGTVNPHQLVQADGRRRPHEQQGTEWLRHPRRGARQKGQKECQPTNQAPPIAKRHATQGVERVRQVGRPPVRQERLEILENDQPSWVSHLLSFAQE